MNMASTVAVGGKTATKFMESTWPSNARARISTRYLPCRVVSSGRELRHLHCRHRLDFTVEITGRVDGTCK